MMTDERNDMLGFASGDAKMDSEHHMQIELLAALSEAVSSDVPDDSIDVIADRLIEYSKVHFTSEELLMRLYGYEHMAAHSQDHERALGQMAALKNALLAGDRDKLSTVLDQLTRLIGGHIRTADRAFAEFVATVRTGNAS